MRRLPATIEELAGARAARWIRESTPGQFDRYGPEAQAEFQDRAIARLGLTDSGLAWRAAHSGRTVYRSAEMADMLGSAQRGEFDVLLVGYVSRWQRNLRRTLELLEDTLHPEGVPVYFCDEEILSSSERHWDQLVDEANDAERYRPPLLRPAQRHRPVHVKKVSPNAMVHPTEKPVELPRRAIEYSSLPRETVLDPFAGSGSTLAACEQTGRRGVPHGDRPALHGRRGGQVRSVQWEEGRAGRGTCDRSGGVMNSATRTARRLEPYNQGYRDGWHDTGAVIRDVG